MTELEYQALILSLKVGAYAVLWLIPLGIALAWLLSRKEFIGKSILDSLIHLPLVLPPVVIGYLLLISLGRQGFLGNWLYEHFGLVFSFNWKGAVVACVVVALPLMVRSVRLSLDNVDPKLEHAASTLGASPLKVFFTITLPLTIPELLPERCCLLLVALVNLVPQSALFLTYSGETQTIPLAMYNFIETLGAEIEAARLCVISIALALSTLMISEWLNRKAASRLGAKR
ncbi:molybdate ABC transporter permease subunit [Vibrio harveyi]|nr:molybdate ABC transporter permease subunit [Vibrio harveyi]